MKLLTSILTAVLLVLTSCTSFSEKKAEKVDENYSSSRDQEPIFAEASIKNDVVISPIFYVTAGSGLSLRQGTNLKSTKILTIPYGGQVQHLSSPKHTTMTVAGIQGDMIEVNYQGATGFVFSGYLSTLSPPLEDETPTAYAKRLSQPENEIKVSKVKNTKGEAYGLTTTIALPASSWGEAYSLAQGLFDIPKNIVLDLTNVKKSTVVNTKKRLKTQTDQVVITRDNTSIIKNIEYSYALRDYTRTVIISKSGTDYILSEEEVSK